MSLAPTRSSRIGCRNAVRGSAPPLGRDHRPEWVSWRPTSRSSLRPQASVWASTSVLRSSPRAASAPSTMASWWGLARADGSTATASPPQISLAPLSPKRRHRRRTRSVGRPSVGGVPPLHRQDRPAVPDRQLAGGTVDDGERSGEWAAELDLVVDRDLDAEAGAAIPQVGGSRQALHLHDVDLGGGRLLGGPRVRDALLPAHAPASRSSAISARTSRSDAGRVAAPAGTAGELSQPRWCRNSAASWR